MQYPGAVDAYVEVPVSERWLQEQHPYRSNSASDQAASASSPGTPTHGTGARGPPDGSGAADQLRIAPHAGPFGTCKYLLQQVSCGPQADTADKEGVAERSVIVRMSMQVHSPGCLHIVIHSAGCQPPFLLQNKTSLGLLYRQAGSSAAWKRLQPMSAVGYTWPNPSGACPLCAY